MKTAREIMSTDVYTVSPSTTIAELAKLFTSRRVSGFPVVEGGKLVGVVTESDLIHQNERLHIPTTVAIFDAVFLLGSTRKVEEELRKMTATTVGEIMAADPVTVSPDADIGQIATIMGERGAHTLPVVDSAGALVGVVGKLDLIRAIA